MTIRKTFQGAWVISAIVDDVLVTKQYFYYTKQEAMEEFKEFLKREYNMSKQRLATL